MSPETGGGRIAPIDPEDIKTRRTEVFHLDEVETDDAGRDHIDDASRDHMDERSETSEAQRDESASRRVFLGLGSNLGNRMSYLTEAVQSLPEVVAVSPVYETDPVGGPPGQGPYLNLVVELDTALSARRLLGICHRLESAADRVREERWGPRTLDVDVLLVGSEVVEEPDLVVPHPRMWQRRFVLAPLADLAPELVTTELITRAWGPVHLFGRVEES